MLELAPEFELSLVWVKEAVEEGATFFEELVVLGLDVVTGAGACCVEVVGAGAGAFLDVVGAGAGVVAFCCVDVFGLALDVAFWNATAVLAAGAADEEVAGR